MLHLLFLLLPLLLLLLFKKPPTKTQPKKTPNLPPGPKPLPILGNILQLTHLPHTSLLHLSNQYGPLTYLKLGNIPTIIASSKEIAIEILKTQDHTFCSRPQTLASSKFSYGGLDIAFSPFNNHWKQLRKFSHADLFSTSRVHSFRSIREEEVETLMKTITKFSLCGKLVNFSEFAMCLFNNMTYREVFGKRLSGEGECGTSPHHEMILAVVNLLGGFNVSDFFCEFGWVDFVVGSRRRLERSFREMDGILEREIEERLVSGRRGGCDFLDVLLLAQVEMDPLLGFLLSREEIKALLMDMFIGGTVTSAITIVWAMTELMRNKQAMNKAQEEVRKVIGKKGKVEEEDLKQLHYLKLVIKETLRLHPAAPLLGPRECMKDTKINGYDIPAKTRVIVNITSISRDPEWWPNDPDCFRPERFENSSINYNGNHFEFIPFGSGRRICPGIALGLVSVEIGLANMLYGFNWKLPEGMEEKDVDIREHFGIGVSKKTPLLLMANPVNLEGCVV